jgi:hypothetical protein
MHQQLYGLTIADTVPDYEEWLKRIHPDEKDSTEQLLNRAKASDSKVFWMSIGFFQIQREGSIYSAGYLSNVMPQVNLFD